MRRTDQPVSEQLTVGDLSIDVSGHSVARVSS